MCWPSPSENRQRSNRKDRDFDPVRSPWKIAISISISMIVTALVECGALTCTVSAPVVLMVVPVWSVVMVMATYMGPVQCFVTPRKHEISSFSCCSNDNDAHKWRRKRNTWMKSWIRKRLQYRNRILSCSQCNCSNSVLGTILRARTFLAWIWRPFMSYLKKCPM